MKAAERKKSLVREIDTDVASIKKDLTRTEVAFTQCQARRAEAWEVFCRLTEQVAEARKKFDREDGAATSLSGNIVQLRMRIDTLKSIRRKLGERR